MFFLALNANITGCRVSITIWLLRGINGFPKGVYHYIKPSLHPCLGSTVGVCVNVCACVQTRDGGKFRSVFIPKGFDLTFTSQTNTQNYPSDFALL